MPSQDSSRGKAAARARASSRSSSACLRIAVAGALLAGSTAGAQTEKKKPADPGAAPAVQAPKPATSAPKPSTQTPPPAKKAEPPAAATEEQIPPAAPGALFPSVVARVNSKAILGRDLEQRIQTQLAPMGNPRWSNLRAEYRQELIRDSLGELIGAELIYQKAVSAGVKATDAEVAAEFTRFTKNFASDAELNMALTNRGLDRPGLNRELEKSLTISKWVQENVVKKIAVAPAEVSQYYKDHTEEFRHAELVRTSHVLITVPNTATAEQERLARQRAESLLARAKKGEDFAKLAKENSTDPSASQGGDIGTFPRGQLAPEYEEAAFALPVGGISNVVRTQFGFHIIKITDKKKAGIAPLDEVQAQLTDFLKDQRAQAELAKLVEQLRVAAKIVAYIDTGSGSAAAAAPAPTKP